MDETEACTANQTQLKQFIEAEKGRLLPILCLYAVRAELATIERSAKAVAAELLDDLATEAFKHADQFDPSRQPFAWLLGIASSLLQHRQEWLGKHIEPGKASDGEPGLSEDEVFDQMSRLFSKDPAEIARQDVRLLKLANTISLEDQRVLRLAVHHDLDGEALAEELGMPPGSARVRLHRALDHLRAAIQE
jgi:DNA-directed RNA polymerase specialized sigma24 family protein